MFRSVCADLSIGTLVAVAVSILAAGPTLAAKGSFSIHPKSTVAMNNETMITSNIWLQETGETGSKLKFSLPMDYKKNSPFEIHMLAWSPTQNCKMRIVPVKMLRYRTGRILQDSMEGLSKVKGSPNFKRGDHYRMMPIVLRISPDAEFGSQKPGDVFDVTIARKGDHPKDTCAIGYIRTIDIRYKRS